MNSLLGDQEVPFSRKKENNSLETGGYPRASTHLVIGLVLLSGRKILKKSSGGPLRGRRPASFLGGKTLGGGVRMCDNLESFLFRHRQMAQSVHSCSQDIHNRWNT
jgi:hypothetical protein